MTPLRDRPERWALMLAGVIVVFGGVFALKAFFAKQTNNFFDNMPQPAVAELVCCLQPATGHRALPETRQLPLRPLQMRCQCHRPWC